MSALTYRSDLKDARWQERRLRIMERDDFKCVICRRATSGLDIHHKAYREGRRPWEYEDDELATLCSICHTRLHATHGITVIKDPEKIQCCHCNKPLDEGGGSGRNEKHDPICEVCVIKMEEERTFEELYELAEPTNIYHPHT